MSFGVICITILQPQHRINVTTDQLTTDIKQFPAAQNKLEKYIDPEPFILHICAVFCICHNCVDKFLTVTFCPELFILHTSN